MRKTIIVIGIVIAQYTQNLASIMSEPCPWNDGMEKRAARNVPGRNAMVIMATVFIDEPSRLLAAARLTAARASSCVRRMNS